MPRVVWTDAFAVGIKSLDDQNKSFIALLNALVDEQDANARTCPSEDLVGHLKAYAAEHFHIEEGYMQAFGYPDYAAHDKEHRAFLDTVGQFEAACATGKANPQDIIDFMQDWLSAHLAGADRQMGRFLEDYL